MNSKFNAVSMITARCKIIMLVAACVFALAVAVATLSAIIGAGEAARATAAETPSNKLWQAVAPGRVEPWSGEIRIAAPVVGRIGEVLVKVNDKVFAGEPLVRLDDDEVRARLLAAQAQIALRRRARNDQHPPSRGASRRQAEDAVADGEMAIVEARSMLDKAAAAKRADSGADANIDQARAVLTRAQDRLMQQKADLRRIEADIGTPLPTQAESQLNIARAELLGVQAAVEKMTIRAPIASTVLQINAKAGELAAPSVVQPLLLLGDISAMRVRAELDERDFGEIKIGQSVLVRAAAFREKEFAGKVLSITPIIQSGHLSSRDQRNLTDVNVAEVVVDLSEPGPLVVGMKVDVYFRYDTPRR